MLRRLHPTSLLVATVAGGLLAGADLLAQSAAAGAHVAAARAAAGQEHTAVFDNLRAAPAPPPAPIPAPLVALSKRGPGDPHPFVIGNDSVRRYLTMVGECARAGLARLPPA
jgi:hypothetical protein